MDYRNRTNELKDSWSGGIFTKLMLLPFLKPLTEALLTALVMTSYSRPTRIGLGVLQTDLLETTDSLSAKPRKCYRKPPSKGIGFKSKANSTLQKGKRGT